MFQTEKIIMTGKNLKNQKSMRMQLKKINGYSKGFNFTIPYYKMTQGQKNAMHIITSDCVKGKIIDSVSFGLNLAGEITEETFVRL